MLASHFSNKKGEAIERSHISWIVRRSCMGIGATGIKIIGNYRDRKSAETVQLERQEEIPMLARGSKKTVSALQAKASHQFDCSDTTRNTTTRGFALNVASLQQEFLRCAPRPAARVNAMSALWPRLAGISSESSGWESRVN